MENEVVEFFNMPELEKSDKSMTIRILPVSQPIYRAHWIDQSTYVKCIREQKMVCPMCEYHYPPITRWLRGLWFKFLERVLNVLAS